MDVVNASLKVFICFRKAFTEGNTFRWFESAFQIDDPAKEGHKERKGGGGGGLPFPNPNLHKISVPVVNVLLKSPSLLLKSYWSNRRGYDREQQQEQQRLFIHDKITVELMC